MSFENYTIIIGVMLALLILTFLWKRLSDVSFILIFLIVLVCGYACSELLYRMYPISVPDSISGLLNSKTVEHLNLFFLHRIFHIIPLTLVLLTYCFFPKGYYSNFFKFGNLNIETDVLNKKAPTTWKKIVSRFAVVVAIVFSVLVVYGINKNGISTVPVSLLGAIVLYASWNCLVEETLFRGLLLSIFSKVLKNNYANILQAFLFGIVHIDPYNIPVSIAKVILFTFIGWFFGRAARETGGIGPSYLMHTMLVLGIEFKLIVLP
jgi:membrane protease YdiL (CAAX protease family)